MVLIPSSFILQLYNQRSTTSEHAEELLRILSSTKCVALALPQKNAVDAKASNTTEDLCRKCETGWLLGRIGRRYRRGENYDRI